MGNLAKSCRLFLFVCANVDVDAAEDESFKVSYNRFYAFSLEVVHTAKSMLYSFLVVHTFKKHSYITAWSFWYSNEFNGGQC